MSTAAVLKKAGIKTALIVDDGYDVAPKINDIDAAEWDTFFQDLNGADSDLLDRIYPDGADTDDSILKKDQKFLAALWVNKKEFRAELISPLFDAYERSSAADQATLTNLEKLLLSHGLTVETSGREFAAKAAGVDLVVVDMFWGTPQKAADKDQATDALSKFLNERPENPPAIILMSSNPRITKMRDTFRDQAGIFEAGFGLLKKADINKPERLPKVLRELSYSRPDALKLNSFVNSWRASLTKAVAATEKDIRKLDLHDWAQIDDLLLTGESVSTGSYMLDIFDRVMQHEIERDLKVIKAAQKLDSLNQKRYPAMATPSTRDTLSILTKTLYRHPSRRKLIPEKGYPVQYGEIIGLKKDRAATNVFSGTKNRVYFVMTPSCDLMPRKNSASHVTLVAGTYEILSEGTAGGSLKSLHTAVLQVDTKTKVKIKWDPADIRSLTMRQVKLLLGDSGPGQVIASMRENPANSLRQQILSHLGRIGITAALPSTFDASIELYYPGPDKKPVRLVVKGHGEITGTCYAGRDDKGNPKKRVPLDPDAYHSIYDALNALEQDDVERHSQDQITRIMSPKVFEQLFSQGFVLFNSDEKPSKLELEEDGSKVRLGTVVLNQSLDSALKAAGNKPLKGLIVKLTTIQP